jgi:hypothetical protein
VQVHFILLLSAHGFVATSESHPLLYAFLPAHIGSLAAAKSLNLTLQLFAGTGHAYFVELLLNISRAQVHHDS